MTAEKQRTKPTAAPKAGKATAPVKKGSCASSARTESRCREPKPKAALSGATVTVTQTGSAIGRRSDQQATLIGLGLNKKGRTRVLQDTPSVRGMIYARSPTS